MAPNGHLWKVDECIGCAVPWKRALPECGRDRLAPNAVPRRCGIPVTYQDIDSNLDTLTYDATSNLTRIDYANGQIRLQFWSERSDLTGIHDVTSSSAMIQRFTYTYDANRNRTVGLENDGSLTTYTLDAKDRLTQDHRTGSNAYNNTYSYDAQDNPTWFGENGASQTFNASGQLVTFVNSAGTTTLTYDANGNNTLVTPPSGAPTTMTYSYENRMASHVQGATTTDRTYGADGLERSSAVGGNTTTLVWDGLTVIQERGASVKPYFALGMSLMGEKLGSTRIYYLPDALGSVVCATDFGTQSVQVNQRFSGYGQRHAGSATSLTRGWVGAFGYRTTGLTFAGFALPYRDYAREVGRWTSRDLLWPREWAYAYVDSAPTTYVDLTGRHPSLPTHPLLLPPPFSDFPYGGKCAVYQCLTSFILPVLPGHTFLCVEGPEERHRCSGGIYIEGFGDQNYNTCRNNDGVSCILVSTDCNYAEALCLCLKHGERMANTFKWAYFLQSGTCVGFAFKMRHCAYLLKPFVQSANNTRAVWRWLSGA